VPELLFHPSDIGINQMGVSETIVDSVESCIKGYLSFIQFVWDVLIRTSYCRGATTFVWKYRSCWRKFFIQGFQRSIVIYSI
jgi:hypothetical protein